MAKHLPRRDAGDRGSPAKVIDYEVIDYEEIARVLSPIFSEDKKPVVLSVRACRERMNGLISKYLEEDKKALFPAKRRQRHAKVNFGADGKRETSNR